MQNSPWITSRPLPSARLRLFCFPFAGGSAAHFLPWQSALSPEIQVCAVQPPGRGARFHEPPLTDWGSVIGQLCEVLSEYDDLPYAFFGHSLGGLLAFELTRACVDSALPLPRHLFVSATNAPSTTPDRPDVTRMNDEALIARLRDYNGTPAEVIDNRELMELLLPVIRADLTLLQNYRYQVRDPLTVPLSIMAGTTDSHLAHQTFSAWKDETTGPFCQHSFAGDHFYIQPEREAVLALLKETVAGEY